MRCEIITFGTKLDNEMLRNLVIFVLSVYSHMLTLESRMDRFKLLIRAR